jgi:CHAD domain-containing protein
MAKKIKWDEAAGAAQNARRELPAVVAEYFAAGRAAVAGKGSPAAWHRLRLRTKRLRYTLELFAGCYGPGLDERLGALHEAQQILGDLNDCAAAGRLIDGLLPHHSPQRLRVRRFLDARARRKVAEFRAFWTGQLDKAGEEQAWQGYLSRARQSKSANR